MKYKVKERMLASQLPDNTLFVFEADVKNARTAHCYVTTTNNKFVTHCNATENLVDYKDYYCLVLDQYPANMVVESVNIEF